MAYAPYGNKRDPVNHRTKAQERRRTRGEQATLKEKKHRAPRTAARREMIKKGLVEKYDGKDVDHKNGLKGGNGRRNLAVVTAKRNRSDGGAKSRGGKGRKRG